MNDYVDAIDLEVQKNPSWNIVKLIFASFCFLSSTVLFKIPQNFYFGSGWTLMIVILFPLLFGGCFIYLQMNYGAIFKCGMLQLMEKNIPLGLIFTVGCCLRNFVHIIFTSGIVTHCIIYIFFTLFNCDNKLCYGNPFPWSSCKDKWTRGACFESKLTDKTPSPADKFYENFVLQQTPQIIATASFPAWFEYEALIIAPHFIGWLLLLLFVIGGSRSFGNLLYFLTPLTMCTFLVCFIYSMISADVNKQWAEFRELFFHRFPSHVPINKVMWDQYEYEPLVWGILSSFANLSIGLHIWNGVFPIMGKWIGHGKVRSYVSWLLLVIPTTIMIILHTMMTVAFMASSYNKEYLRCQVARGFSFPFTVMANTFSKLDTHEGIAVLYYLTILLFLLNSQSLLLISTIETIVDHLKMWHHKFSSHSIKYYRIICVTFVVAMYFLSYTTILKSGIYWMQLMEFYLDRFSALLMGGQVSCILVVYALSKHPGLMGKSLMKIFVIIFFIFMAVISFAVLVWYIIDTRAKLPNQDCYYETIDLNLVPIPYPYTVIGWIIAVSPVLIGLLIGLLLIGCHAKKLGYRGCGEMLNYCLHGSTKGVSVNIDLEPQYQGHTSHAQPQQPQPHSNKSKRGTGAKSWASHFQSIGPSHNQDSHEVPLVTMNTGPRNLGHGDHNSSTLYINDDVDPPGMFLYKQKRSLQRPLIEPGSSSAYTSNSGRRLEDSADLIEDTTDDDRSQAHLHQYAKINKKQKRPRSNFATESDI